MNTYMNLIGGKHVESFTKEYFQDTNPADLSDVVGLFPRSSSKDVDAAVSAARTAFPAWRDLPPPARGELIFKAAELLMKNQELLASIIVREMGKTVPESMGDIKSSADVAYFMAGEGRRMYGQTTYSALFRRWAVTKRVPIGVCGLITAWNAPMAIIAWKLFPAIACGNTVVLKPSEDTPLTAHMFGDLIIQAGFPGGVVNIVFGTGPETGEALVKHHETQVISFTGSSRVGRMISEQCGKVMKRCSLELGGKNGLIVMDDADLPAAAKAVAQGAFSTAGQRCASTSRVFIHEAVYDSFLSLLFNETKQMVVGPGNDPQTRVCPIINKRQFISIMNYIENAKQEGASLLHGGKSIQDGVHSKGLYIEPTIFSNVNPRSRLAREEIFGPVLAIFKIRSLSEGIEMVNDADYGLTASIYTNNINSAMLALEKIHVGVCYVNAPTFGSEPHMPFGGVKQSGNGQREPGTQALDVFSEWKTIYVDYSQAKE